MSVVEDIVNLKEGAEEFSSRHWITRSFY